MTATFMCSLCT